MVVAGDSLWAIAARHLPSGATDAEIAAAWPRWYEANAEVIGADPDLIQQGQVSPLPRGRRGGPMTALVLTRDATAAEDAFARVRDTDTEPAPHPPTRDRGTPGHGWSPPPSLRSSRTLPGARPRCP